MEKRKRFCAECGDTSMPLHDNFCQDCYWKHNRLARLKKERIELPYCLECGSVKLSSGWTGSNPKEEIPEVIAYAYYNNIVTIPEAVIQIVDISELHWINPNPDFLITFRVQSDMIPEFSTHSETLELFVKINAATCSTCIKRKTGSGEVTVQFRAKNRGITKSEMDQATTVAFSLVSEMNYESPEAYLSDIVENYGGLDFFFGNNAIAEKFIDSIKNQWTGHYEKNYKLVTEDKDERRVYAVTHLFRLPEVIRGDLVEYQDQLYVVTSISKAGVHLQSLQDKSRALVKDWNSVSPLDPPPSITRKMIISEDISSNSYLVMDLQNYSNEEISRDQFHKHLDVSEEISFLSWKDKYYLIPENYYKQT